MDALVPRRLSHLAPVTFDCPIWNSLPLSHRLRTVASYQALGNKDRGKTRSQEAAKKKRANPAHELSRAAAPIFKKPAEKPLGDCAPPAEPETLYNLSVRILLLNPFITRRDTFR